jgi:hypothetical protein
MVYKRWTPVEGSGSHHIEGDDVEPQRLRIAPATCHHVARLPVKSVIEYVAPGLRFWAWVGQVSSCRPGHEAWLARSRHRLFIMYTMTMH